MKHTMNAGTEPLDLEAVRDRAELTRSEVAAICQEGANRWRVSTPARPAHDSDLIIMGTYRDVGLHAAEVQKLRKIVSRFVSAAEDVLSDAEAAETETAFSGTTDPAHLSTSALKALRAAVNAVPVDAITEREATS